MAGGMPGMGGMQSMAGGMPGMGMPGAGGFNHGMMGQGRPGALIEGKNVNSFVFR